jgi:hypothetical protein
VTKIQTLSEWKTGLAYHATLNPDLWKHDTLLPDVKAALDKIAADFINFTGIDRSKITDIVITGSNCNYNYSFLSDIDLHVVAEYDEGHKNEAGIGVQDAFNAFKNLYNASHHIRVKGVPIEVYVQPTSEHFTSNAGVFSLKSMKWIQHPVKVHVDLDEREIKRKADPVIRDIDAIVDGRVTDPAKIHAVKAKIRQLRAAGLEAGGEFGIENLAFKAIRNAGFLDKLSKYSDALNDTTLSL